MPPSPGAEPAAAVLGARIGIVHEWLDNPGGAEQVLREFLATFPNCEVWSLWNLPPARDQLDVDVRTTWLGRSPLAGHKAAALPLMPLAWRNLPAVDYDAVLTSSYALAHSARFRGFTGPKLHYVHTPARYWWTPGVDSRGASRAAAGPRAALRAWDRRMAREHRHVAVNSEATRARVRRFWGVDARVIYPPVDTEFFTPGPPDSPLPFDRYVLGVSRWIPYKRLDLVIETAQQLGVPAVIAGSGPMAEDLRAQAATTGVPVHFEVQPSKERLRDLYRGAEALVFPAHEDFGIVPVEAMASGTPVVGPAVGGLLESVVPGRSGTLVTETSPAALAAGVRQARDLRGSDLADAAAGFAAARFRVEMAQWLSEVLAESR